VKKTLIVMLETPSNLSVDENQITRDFTSKFVELFGGKSDAIKAISKAIEQDPDVQIEAESVYVEMPVNRFVYEQYDTACQFAFSHLNADVVDRLRIEVGLRFD